MPRGSKGKLAGPRIDENRWSRRTVITFGEAAMPERFVATTKTPLDGDVDLAAVVAVIPRTFEIRGMFFTRYVAAMGEEWERLFPELDAPAKHGRYHAFESYPIRDYMRVFDRVARARFPGSTREAYRLLARGEVDVFAQSTLGKVTFSMTRDPGAILMRYPDLFKVMTTGPEIHGERIGDRHVRITHPEYRGAWEQGLGVVEGLVLAFDEEPRVDVEVDDDRRVVFDVTW